MTESAAKPNVFKNKNYFLLFQGDFVSNLGNTFFSFAISFYILQITGNNALIQGLFLALGGVVRLLLSPIGGVLADRLNKAKILYITDFIRGGTILAAAAFIFFYSGNNTVQLVVLFAATVILNANGAVFSPAAGSIIRFLVKDNELQQATSYFSVSQSVVSILGVLAAGVLYSVFGILPIIILDGISYILSAVSEMFIKYEYTKSSDQITLKSTFTEMGQGFAYIKQLKPIFAMTIITLCLNFFITPIASNGLVYFCNTEITGDFLFSEFMTPATWLAVLEVSMSVGMLVTSLILGGREQSKNCGRDVKTALALSSLALALSSGAYLVLVAIMKNVNAFLIAETAIVLFLGVAITMINIPINVAFMKAVDEKMLGKATSILSTLSQALVPISSMVAGTIIQYAGLSAVFLFSTIGFILTTVYALFNKNLSKL